MGLCAAIYLVLVKLRVENEIGYVSACNFGATFNCDAVQSSKESLVLGIPISIWAIPTYFVMLVLAWFGLQEAQESDSRETQAKRVSALNILVLLGTVSIVYSCYLAYIQYVKIGAFCLFCSVMYVAQIGTTVCAALATPTRFSQCFTEGFKAALGASQPIALSALVFGLSLGASIFWFEHEKEFTYHSGAHNTLTKVAQLISVQHYEEAVTLLTPLTKRQDEYRNTAESLMKRAIDGQMGGALALQPAPAPEVPVAVVPTSTATKNSPNVASKTPTGTPKKAKVGGRRTDMGWSYFEVPITSDDFVLGPSTATVTFVEFADFECAYCRMLSSHVKQIRNKYKDKVRFVFKFYPMDGACNPRMGGERMHPDGCGTAKASYCAGKQGKFWEFHDSLFSHQGQNQPEKVRGYMEALGLDMAKYDACLKSDAPGNRIRNDVRVAAQAGINGTPRAYINNRLMSGAGSVSIIEYYIMHALKNPSMPAVAAKAVAPTVQMGPMAQGTTQKGSFWIDRYEAAIDKEGRAVSLAGAAPAYVSWFGARDACKAAGKRLCSEEEWASACTGAPAIDNNKNGWFNDDDIEGFRYPYGPFYERGHCHDGQKILTGDPIKTGQKHACRTKAGVYDMTGNVAEWIENDKKKASMVGGNFGSGEGAACNRRGTMFGPGLANNTTGFRCCADQRVLNATHKVSELRANQGVLIGRPVPDFTIKTADGRQIKSSSLKGKVTYITFYASWCGSCKRELPELKSWQTEWGKKKFEVLAIGVDRYEKFSKDFADKYELNYTVAFDPEAKSMGPFNIVAMPTSFVVDKKGIIRHRIVGFKKEDVPGTKAVIKNLL
jgi:protein-disulfide isomerase/uncharacterized membrane protein